MYEQTAANTAASFEDGPQPERPEGHITAEADRLGRTLDALDKTIGRMQERLTPVLGPMIPQDVSVRSTQDTARSGLADLVGSWADHAGSMVERLDVMLQRVEL